MLRTACCILSFTTLLACATPQQSASYLTPPQSVVDGFARQFLNSIQAQSFAARSEFCGYFYTDQSGNLQATQPRRGNFASCELPIPQNGDGIFASYHTHGAYSPNYDNEVPSDIDLISDFSLNLDGYVATPGGRIWRNNAATRDTVQVCGLGCVSVDPNFRPYYEDLVLPQYTVATLRHRADS